MKTILVKNKKGNTKRINTCDQFPTFVGDSFLNSFNGEVELVTVIDVIEYIEQKHKKQSEIPEMFL